MSWVIRMATTLRLTSNMDELLKVICLVDGDSGAAVMNKALESYFKTRIADPAFKNKFDLKVLQMKAALKPFTDMLESVADAKPGGTHYQRPITHPNHIKYTEGNHNDVASIWCEEHKRFERLENQDVV